MTWKVTNVDQYMSFRYLSFFFTSLFLREVDKIRIDERMLQ